MSEEAVNDVVRDTSGVLPNGERVLRHEVVVNTDLENGPRRWEQT